jgi:DNA polymerase-3 subunit epsilon
MKKAQIEDDLGISLGEETATAAAPAADRYLVVDCETSGLPQFKLPADDPLQPYIASFAAIFVNAELEVEREYYALIKPDGWVMSPEVTAINGLTTERLMAEGVPITEALEIYTVAIDDGRVIVAHNAQFDCKMLRGSLRRLSIPDRFELTRNICTMRGLTDVCRIPPAGGRGGYKFPKLSEACVHFGFEDLGDHTALADARACLSLFRKMRELGVVPEAKVHFAKTPPAGKGATP